MKPEIPVGGRLTHFVEKWKSITTDQWLIDLVAEGYKLEFNKIPKFQGVKETHVTSTNLELISLEVKELLAIGCIEHVPVNQIMDGFYSTFFLVKKKTGDMRPVINLRPLNKYLRKQHFKMDTLKTVLNLVQLEDWAVTLDLKDAYLHIPIFKNHKKYLRFCIQGKCYQFRSLPFGPTVAPRIFTKVVTAVAAYLRQQTIRLTVYLDDWLIVNRSINSVSKDRDYAINLLLSLGFIVNVKKSNLCPVQHFVYLGGQFALDRGTVSPTQDRVIALNAAIQTIQHKICTARDYLHLLGLMASCIQIVPNARLYMRPIQKHLLSHWRPASQEWEAIIPFTQQLNPHLAWWLNSANILKGQSFVSQTSSVVLTTDASMYAWGGHIGNLVVQGQWSLEEKSWHINCLELEAVIRSVKHFLPRLKGQCVLIRSDNTTVVQYINKQGGTKSSILCQKAQELWQIFIQNQIEAKSAHIVGSENVLADQLSRTLIKETEWSLNQSILHRIFQILGSPSIDLFASVHNHKLPVFCSWTAHPQAYAIDALSISWESMYAYAFPPVCLIPRVLAHVLTYPCRVILIAPLWPRRPWYPQLLQLLIANPIAIPNVQNLLRQPKTKIYHQNPELLNLHAWLISNIAFDQRVFQNELRNYSWRRGGQVLERTTRSNSHSTIAGVLKGMSIPIQQL